MAYQLRVTITNPGTRPRRTVIYGGTVFEVQDPFSRVQNLVAVDDTVVTVAPGQSEVIEVDTWCLNQSFAPPRNTPMRPTALTMAQAYSSQTDLWIDMNQRR